MTLTIASAFFNGALMSCLLPILLLIVLVAYYVMKAEHMPSPDKDFERKDDGTQPPAGSSAVGNG